MFIVEPGKIWLHDQIMKNTFHLKLPGGWKIICKDEGCTAATVNVISLLRLSKCLTGKLNKHVIFKEVVAGFEPQASPLKSGTLSSQPDVFVWHLGRLEAGKFGGFGPRVVRCSL